MPRLKSRDKFPPGEFQVIHPEAGMKAPFAGSFREAVLFELAWRRKNAALAEKLGLPPDLAMCEAWVDEQNAIRCLQSGWGSFVDTDGSSLPIDPAQKKSLFGVAAVGVAKGLSALSAYQSMFGPDGPVGKDVAEARAAVCHKCPKNDTQRGFTAYFVRAAADGIMGLLGALKDLGVQVAEPKKLGICQACLCPMRAKVFVSTKWIRGHIPEMNLGDLQPANPKCWILEELGK